MTNAPQIKICGLSTTQDALACARFGADAVGFVFYPPSPRYIDPDRVKEIGRTLPDTVDRIGVFVNHPFSEIMPISEQCGLTAVQLHGSETPDLVRRLRKEGIHVIKTLFLMKFPTLAQAAQYHASTFLIESGMGTLPGGNALAWDWRRVTRFGRTYPFILAGGLTPFNVAEAVRVCRPDAVDVSSGVEVKPGHKDITKIKAFLHKVKTEARVESGPERKPRRIFYGPHSHN